MNIEEKKEELTKSVSSCLAITRRRIEIVYAETAAAMEALQKKRQSLYEIIFCG